MKIKWEAEDIWAGRRAKKPGTMGDGSVIGYEIGANATSATWTLVDLSDGMTIARQQTRESIADLLTSNGSFPVELLPAEDRKSQENKVSKPEAKRTP